MKLEKLAAIAETVSSVAIVATLAYLAIQTQQTNRALLASSRSATMSADVTVLAASFDAADVAAAMNKRPEELSEMERRQLFNWLTAFVRVREFAWFQYQGGLMDEATWQSYVRPIVGMTKLPSVEPAWTAMSRNLNPEFAAYVNRLRDE